VFSPETSEGIGWAWSVGGVNAKSEKERRNRVKEIKAMKEEKKGEGKKEGQKK